MLDNDQFVRMSDNKKWWWRCIIILTWYRRYRDQQGGSPRTRPFHCTSVGLTPAIAPNVGNSGTQFISVGVCVRANPWICQTKIRMPIIHWSRKPHFRIKISSMQTHGHHIVSFLYVCLSSCLSCCCLSACLPVFLSVWLQHHSYFHDIYPSYSSSSDGWGRQMAIPCTGAVLRARKRTRVTVVEFHVSLFPISVSPFFPLCMLNVWI